MLSLMLIKSVTRINNDRSSQCEGEGEEQGSREFYLNLLHWTGPGIVNHFLEKMRPTDTPGTVQNSPTTEGDLSVFCY